MSNNLVDLNHQSFIEIHEEQESKHQYTKDNGYPTKGWFQIDPKIFLARKNKMKHQKDLNYGGDQNLVKDKQNEVEVNQYKHESSGSNESLNANELDPASDTTNHLSKPPPIAVQPQPHQHTFPTIKQKHNQNSLLPQTTPFPQDQPLKQPIPTKKQIQQQKQHLNQLKQKKKQQQRKKLVQKLNQQQKARLQKLKQQTKQYQQMKKQKDNDIMQFKNQLQSLKKNKQQEVFKQKQKEEMREIQQQRERDQRYYREMMLQKDRMERERLMREEEERRRQRVINEQKKKKREYLKRINSTAYQRMLKEKRQRQEQERRKIEQVRQFLMNRNNYTQKLLQLQNLSLIKQQKPKPVKQKSQLQLQQQHRRLTTKALSAAEIYKMGQEFMQQAHQPINQQDIQQSKLYLSEVYNSLRSSSRTQYKDYLREDKLKRERFFKSTGRLKMNPEIRELKKLIVMEQNSPEKLVRAKLLSERIEAKSLVVKKQTLKLKADSIAAKLKIIEEFT